MIVIVGCVVVLGCVLAGFIWSGGHVGALIHPAEFVTIGGAALGALIVMSPKKVLGDLMRGVMQTLKGTPFSKDAYKELFAVLYDMLSVARRDGMLGLETHVSDPHQSPLFAKYPKIAHNHHVIDFICNAFSPVIEGTADADQLRSLLETDLKVIDEEHHAPIGVLSKTADALPGFGIVAAVLGIVITMGAIDGPVEEIGHKVGAALVGTFLGILASYGFFGPLVGRMEFQGAAELAYFRTIASTILGFVQGMPPKVAIEQARRGVGSEVRPTRQELDEMFKSAEAS
ncbi:MAG TPA: flagellar motor stator protein MotA [Pirellulales bacterium]|jgi:chemotaxis protein MotA|nr:flagellar motor stator protein MotA [Pirellulales bacterium]